MMIVFMSLVATVPAVALKVAQNEAAPSNTEYATPLQQQTQPSYVPQSVALSGPAIIKDWRPGEPIPPGYHPGTRARRGLIGGGAGLFAGFYLSSVLAGAISIDIARHCSTCRGASMLFIPVIGPALEIANTGSVSATASVFLALDAIGQAAGVFMFIYGLAVPKIVLVRNDLASNITIQPYFGGTGGGLYASF